MLKITLISLIFNTVSCHFNYTIELENSPGDECFRNCDDSDRRICYFKWHMEHYQALGQACGSCGQLNGNKSDCFNPQCITVDGLQRGVMSINRQIPGPSIHVCKDDLIVVDVTNAMGGTGVAIHWHGIHQRKTPYMDGVPFITQCPIHFSTTFRYAFQASESGTQFYHSHSGHHKANGHYGGLVVRQNSRDEINFRFYDHDKREHLIIVSDWMISSGEMKMPGTPEVKPNLEPSNLLINGKGTVNNNATLKADTQTPLEVFRVERGQSYRFRLVNSLSHVCPCVFEIEKHSLLIIASDSFELQPATTDLLFSMSGERYDFVLNANQSGDTFWMRLKSVGPCTPLSIQQFAVLIYETSSTEIPKDLKNSKNSKNPKKPTSETDSTSPSVDQAAFPDKIFLAFSESFGNGSSLNNPKTTCGDNDTKDLCITDLSSYEERPDITDVRPDHQFYLGFKSHKGTNEELFGNNRYDHYLSVFRDVMHIGVINNISTTFPAFSPLTQPELIDDELFCNDTEIPQSCENQVVCYCTHRLKVKLNSIVELVIVDESLARTVNHPFHLHGYDVFVLGMGQRSDGVPMTIELAKDMVKHKELERSSLRRHAMKDTISVPIRGYTIFRFKADNPGWWLLHCHYEWHLAVGMGLMLQVGEPSDMVKTPAGFPTCNNYQPSLDPSTFK